MATTLPVTVLSRAPVVNVDLISNSTTAVANRVGIAANSARNLISQGISPQTAGASAANLVNGLSSNSKFKDNFAFPQKTSFIKPEQKIRKGNFKTDSLIYPEDLGEYYITIEVNEYSRLSPTEESKKKSPLFIHLPIPANLQEQFGMSYADKNLGILGGIERGVADIINRSGDEFQKGIGEAIKSTDAEGAGRAVSTAILSASGGLAYGARVITGAVDRLASSIPVPGGVQATAVFEKVTGTVLNPFTSLLFQGVNLRSHSFTYKFSPNSQTEHGTLKKIIAEFKRRMHPESEQLILKYPDIFQISFGMKENEPYFFKPCFLESMTVNYAPSGTPAFFTETNDPVEVELTLNFKETEILTRNDFKESSEDNYGFSAAAGA